MALSVNIKLTDQQVDAFKGSNFSICFVRSINEGGTDQQGNVVFASIPSTELKPSMLCEWVEQYQVFEIHTFQGGVKVKSNTDVVDMEAGYTVKFDDHGHGAKTGPIAGDQAFHVENGFSPNACVGVNNYDPVRKAFTPIYVSTPNPLHTRSDLTPIKKFGIFLEKRLKTETMIDHTSTPIFSFDMTQINTISLEYKTDTGLWLIL